MPKTQRKPRKSPLKLDPTRTITLRKALVRELRKRFARLRYEIRKMIVDEDALGLAADAKAAKLAGNAFCPTGEGGGVDPSCSPGSGVGRAEKPAEATSIKKQIGELKAKAKLMHSSLVAEAKSLRATHEASMESANQAANNILAIEESEHPDHAEFAREYTSLDEEIANFRSDYYETYKEKVGSLQKMLVTVDRMAVIGKKLVQDSEWSADEIDKNAGLVKDVQKHLEIAERSLKEHREVVKTAKAVKTALTTNNAASLQSLVANQQDWRFRPSDEKVKAFQAWLKSQFGRQLRNRSVEELLRKYTEDGFKKGAGRAFDDAKRAERAIVQTPERLDFYNGTRDGFLRTAFGQPETVAKVKLLASRSYTDLEGVTEDMSVRMSRTLVDGLVQGQNPREIARGLDDDLDLGRGRAETIARTEIIRAHAEGTLDAFEDLGVEEVGVAVEWSTADDERVCPLCESLEGVVLKLDEARGMLPRHPACRCSWIPSNVGEDTKGQLRTKGKIDAALEEAGVDREVDDERPKSILNFSRMLHNVFCPTGPGGGIDASCSPSDASGGSADSFTGVSLALSSAVAGLKMAGIAAGHMEHVAKAYVADKIEQAVTRLPASMQGPVRGAFAVVRAGTQAAFVTYTASQAFAERVSRERGHSAEESRRLRGVLSSIDLAAAKPIALTLGPKASFAPVASLSYLAYSTARDPAATMRAATKAIKGLIPSQELRQGLGNNMLANADGAAGRLIADALERHGFDDWYIALLSAALGETDDIGAAIAAADGAYEADQAN